LASSQPRAVPIIMPVAMYKIISIIKLLTQQRL
jgi:hypothetical protein